MSKNLKYYVLFAFFLVAGVQLCLASSGGDERKEVIVIIVGEGGGGQTNPRPRMPAYRPLTCVYDTDTGLLTVNSRNLGLSFVQVQNLTTGEMFSAPCNGDYYSALYLSGAPGLWQLTITLEDGSIYIGMFNL